MAGRVGRRLPGPSRKIPPHVLAIFDKYVENNVRHLDKTEATTMLQTEFNLEPEQAQVMFETFDKDQNGVMSVWEFELFFQCVGEDAHDIVNKFKELDTDGSGKLDAEEAREGLKTLKTATGRTLQDNEIDFFIKTTANEENVIDLGQFTNLLHRLKLYRADPPPKNIKLKA